MNEKKPPLGLVPKYIHEEKRLHAIREAIIRYVQEGYVIPLEWVEEYNELISRGIHGS